MLDTLRHFAKQFPLKNVRASGEANEVRNDIVVIVIVVIVVIVIVVIVVIPDTTSNFTSAKSVAVTAVLYSLNQFDARFSELRTRCQDRVYGGVAVAVTVGAVVVAVVDVA